jgi:hypothetical protein
MMPLTIQRLDDEAHCPELVDLWRRRSQLSKQETAALYDAVKRALHAYHPPELRCLRDDKDELVAQFIFLKVLRLASNRAESRCSAESAPSSFYAIRAYFRRFLIDCLRSADHQRHVSMETEAIRHEVGRLAHPGSDPVESVLMQHGLSESSVRRAAHAFVQALDDVDRIILAGSIGRCSDEKGSLAALAAAHRVSSCHYRAIRLGVKVKKTASAEDYAQSKIGRWLVDVLGIDIGPDNDDVILLVLNLLAEESNQIALRPAPAMRSMERDPRITRPKAVEIHEITDECAQA